MRVLRTIAIGTLVFFDWGLAAEGGDIRVPEGFEARQIYSVPSESQGSWVALTVDDAGRLIAGDQRGRLYRISLDRGEVEKVEALDTPVGHVNGLVFAFGSLYAVVADDVFEGSGLYRLRDSDGDDQFEDVRKLLDFAGQGEHGPHSVVTGPSGEWLYVIAGNKTAAPRGGNVSSKVPRHWGEDDLLPRLWGPIGSEKGTTAPGGWIARTDPQGERWELLAIGLRNGFDIAFNRVGELFTADADAEFDMGTPWYQPTRLLHIVPGTDYGWRSGSGKWPTYFADTLPPVYEFGPGSPTGMTFGHGADFPERYREALFTCDWSWGRVFATWLEPVSATYVGKTEEFLTGVPLPIVDLIVNPFDGDMYFVLGGRGASSGLYRLRYVGRDRPEADASREVEPRDSLTKRRELEGLVTAPAAEAAEGAWPYLSSDDRALRHAARLVLEQTPVAAWGGRALTEADPVARMTALLALGRAGEPELRERLLASLLELDWQRFSAEERLLGMRCMEVAFIRMGIPATTGEASVNGLRARRLLERQFPADDERLNAEALKLLVALKSEEATARAVTLLERAATKEGKLRMILPLRLQERGWTTQLRERFFEELGAARGWKGGLSLSKYVEAIVADALETVPMPERERYRQIFEASKPKSAMPVASTRGAGKEWTMEALLPISAEGLEGRDIESGRKAFTAAACFACHRVGNEGGGIGPDLTAAMRRFSPRDLLEAIIHPSETISDQYGLTAIRKTGGEVIHGKVVNYYGDAVGIQTDALDGANILRVPRSEIASMEPSPVSPMPPGLLNALGREEILDMLAFLGEASR